MFVFLDGAPVQLLQTQYGEACDATDVGEEVLCHRLAACVSCVIWTHLKMALVQRDPCFSDLHVEYRDIKL